MTTIAWVTLDSTAWPEGTGSEGVRTDEDTVLNWSDNFSLKWREGKKPREDRDHQRDEDTLRLK
jgi:hypothetical protein